jgi:hypothetical protein
MPLEMGAGALEAIRVWLQTGEEGRLRGRLDRVEVRIYISIQAAPEAAKVLRLIPDSV